MKETFLRTRRQELHLSLKDVADAVGVYKATVQRWETGVVKDIGSSRIMALARILQLKPSDMLQLYSNAKFPFLSRMDQLETLLNIISDMTEDEIAKIIQVVNLMKSMKG